MLTVDAEMSKEKIVKVVHVRLNREETEIFNIIANYLGLRNDAEVLRHLMTQYYNENKNKFSLKPPAYEHLNLDEKGVKIIDNTGPRKFIADIYFKPDGIWCDFCKTNNCPHIQFAIEQEDVAQIIRKHKREGWKLPEPE